MKKTINKNKQKEKKKGKATQKVILNTPNPNEADEEEITSIETNSRVST
jgi:hypothetical protein